jgi:hypothetical protein
MQVLKHTLPPALRLVEDESGRWIYDHMTGQTVKSIQSISPGPAS